MSLSETELKIGKTSFKGVYIAIVLSLATSLSGVIWTASSLYARLEAVEQRKIPNIKPLDESVQLIKQQLVDNDVSQLQAKLATLGTNLETILGQQEKLLELQQEVSDLSKTIEGIKATVAEAKLLSESNKNVAIEIDNIWDALDHMANPLR